LSCFLAAGATRKDARRGRRLHGRYLRPSPEAGRNKAREPRRGDFPAGEPGLLRGLRSPLNTFTGDEISEKQ
ncbi:TPA: hypothetical protein ACH0TZ_003814, partial [Citrobacter werkmanii]